MSLYNEWCKNIIETSRTFNVFRGPRKIVERNGVREPRVVDPWFRVTAEWTLFVTLYLPR